MIFRFVTPFLRLKVIPFGEYRFCLNHETYLTKSEAGRKDGVYRHRFVVWDKDKPILFDEYQLQDDA
jgi:hypothetical protein